MKFSFRKKEREAVEEALELDHKTVAEAAKAVWDASLEQFLAREMWVVLVRDPGVGLFAYGVYPTANAANTAIEKGEIFSASSGAVGVVTRLNSHEIEQYHHEQEELF